MAHNPHSMIASGEGIRTLCGVSAGCAENPRDTCSNKSHANEAAGTRPKGALPAGESTRHWSPRKSRPASRSGDSTRPSIMRKMRTQCHESSRLVDPGAGMSTPPGIADAQIYHRAMLNGHHTDHRMFLLPARRRRQHIRGRLRGQRSPMQGGTPARSSKRGVRPVLKAAPRIRPR